MDKNHTPVIPLVDKIGYVLGNLGVGIAMQVIGAYFVFFATAILGIPGSLAGLAVGISVFWDAVTDPLMGYLSDQTRTRKLGRRHPYLIAGSLGIAATVYLIWIIQPGWQTGAKFALMFIILMVFKSAMTVYITPYTALGAELSTDYNERTQIQGIKTIFFLSGLALVSVAGMYFFFQPTPDFPVGQLNPRSYRNIGLAAAILTVASAGICFGLTAKYIPRLRRSMPAAADSRPVHALLKSIQDTVKNRPFRATAFSYLFNNLASALLSSIGLHVFTYTFHLSSQQIALVLGLQFLISIISQPMWAAVSRRMDKKPALHLGLAFASAGSLVFILLVLFRQDLQANPYVFIPFSLLTGVGTGALFTLPLSMVADTIDFDELRSGQRAEGLYYGSLTLYYKASQAIAIFLIGILLDLIRFDASLPVQSDVTTLSLGLLLVVGSLLSFGLSYLSLRGYDLDEEKVQAIQARIAEIKAGA
ncbi:MAG: MFS transporter [Clostridia bacterium]|nr:MFS transporter [Clostridia bacterium]